MLQSVKLVLILNSRCLAVEINNCMSLTLFY